MLQISCNYTELCSQSAVLHFMGSPTERAIEIENHLEVNLTVSSSIFADLVALFS